MYLRIVKRKTQPQKYTKMFANSVRQRILAIDPGQRIEFTWESVSVNTLRHYASNLGKKHGREFHLRTVRSRGVYVISREA